MGNLVQAATIFSLLTIINYTLATISTWVVFMLRFFENKTSFSGMVSYSVLLPFMVISVNFYGH